MEGTFDPNLDSTGFAWLAVKSAMGFRGTLETVFEYFFGMGNGGVWYFFFRGSRQK